MLQFSNRSGLRHVDIPGGLLPGTWTEISLPRHDSLNLAA